MKTKLEMAHEMALAMAADGNVPNENIVAIVWQYADAMQAEAEKRKPSGLPEALKEEWQPDWSQAPDGADAWRMYGDGNCAWLIDFGDKDFKWFDRAPSFNYQGDWKDSLRERPEALCEVDWRVAPEWAKYWAIREDSDTAIWCINKPTVTDDCLLSHGGCSPAPSFGFTGSHIVERPNGF